MKVSVIITSDIHIKTENDYILKKKERLIKAIKSRTRESDKLLILINGDIAFSGKEKEYNIAFEFIYDLVEELNHPDLISIAGNHDCNFDSDETMNEEIRDIVIEKIKGATDPSEIISLTKNVTFQNEYNTFNDLFISEWDNTTIVEENNLFKSLNFQVMENQKLVINLLNTAWCSKKNEEPGSMYFPVSLLNEMKYRKDALVNISLMHHPTHWLEPNNKREFENRVKDASDIIFSGHEHEATITSQVSKEAETVLIESGVLQQNDNEELSSFSQLDITIIEDEEIKSEVIEYEWNKEKAIYEMKRNEKIDIDILQNKIKHIEEGSDKILIFSQDMTNFLTDLGANLYHAQSGTIDLDQIYIYPDFTQEITESDIKQKLTGEKFKEEIFNNNGIWFIEGEKESGKTTLLKKLFKEFYKLSKFPLLVKMDSVQPRNTNDKLQKFMEKEYKKQYVGDTFEKFNQLESNERVIFIDNWENSNLNRDIKIGFISSLSLYFDTIIILSEDLPSNPQNIMQLSSQIQTDFHYLKINQFGYKKREELVDKWISLGNNHTLESEELIQKIDEYTKQINEVIGKSYVPQLPIYLLILLQSIDSGRNLDEFNKQSNGYYYEMLIKETVIKVGINSNEISTLNNYLSYFAYSVFINDKKSLSHSEWKNLHDTYVENYELDNRTMGFNPYMKKLIKSRLISKFNEDSYTFTYNYALYYFTAQYLADNIAQPLIREKIKNLIENINLELNANILVFLSHLSKDNFILDSVIETAKHVLESENELEMEEDIADLNELMTDLPNLVFKNTKTTENRKKYNELRDSTETKDDTHYLQKENSSESLSDQSDIFIEMSMAQRLSEVIGQILKNYSGSIMAAQKHELLNSAYVLNLRAGNKLIKLIKSEKDDLVQFISQEIEKEGFLKSNNQQDIEKAARELLFKFVEVVCASIIQKSIKDTGTKALKVTYDNIMKKDIPTAKKLIISGSVLENLYSKPDQIFIKDFYKESDKNILAKSILRRMVIKYLYLFDVPVPDRQKIANTFDIKYDSALTASIQVQSIKASK